MVNEHGRGSGPVHSDKGPPQPNRSSETNVGVINKRGLAKPVAPVVQPGSVSPSRHRIGEEAHAFADTDNDADSLHHTLGIGNFQAAPGKGTNDRLKALEASTSRTGVLVAVAPFTLGLNSLVRRGDIVHMYAEVFRLVGFNAAYSIALNIPVGFRPTQVMQFQSSQFGFASGVYFQFQYNANNLEERMTAAHTSAANIIASWLTADAMPAA
jgi:hypothetical protein